MNEVRRTVKADPDAVWAVLADPKTYPDWLVGAQLIRGVDEEFPKPGSDFHHSVGASESASIPDRTTSLEAEPGRSLTLKVRARPFFKGIVRFRLVPVKGGTEVAVAETPIGKLRLLGPAITPLIVARNSRSLDKLRDLVEARAASASPSTTAG